VRPIHICFVCLSIRRVNHFNVIQVGSFCIGCLNGQKRNSAVFTLLFLFKNFNINIHLLQISPPVMELAAKSCILRFVTQNGAIRRSPFETVVTFRMFRRKSELSMYTVYLYIQGSPYETRISTHWTLIGSATYVIAQQYSVCITFFFFFNFLGPKLRNFEIA
jgi:hypothetical protein